MRTSSPQGDVLRVEVLDQHDLSPPTDSGLVDLVRLAARFCRCPVAAVMLRPREKKIYSAVFGATLVDDAGMTTPCDETMRLADAGAAAEIHEITDAGISLGGQGWRFYSGTALVSSDGEVLGTLFVVDTVAGELDAEQRDGLRVLGRQVVTRLEVTRSAREIESEARYRQIVEGSLGMICTHDAKGMILSVNRSGAETIGRTVDQVVGHSLAELLPRGAMDSFDGYLSQITKTGEAQGLMHMRHLDGGIRVVAYRNKLIAMAGHEPHVLAFGVDVTEKIQAQAELRALIRQSNSVLESIGDGIFGLDLEGKVRVVNAAAAEMLGYTQEEMLGRSMHETIHHMRSDGTSYSWSDCPINASLEKLEMVRVSTEVFWRKDGSSFPVDYVARPQIDTDTRPGREEHNRAVGVVVAFTDTTERRALEKMKDEFVSTVSHELRTPLTSLRGALGLIHSGSLSSRPERVKQMLEIAMGSADRLVRVVNDILELERIRSRKAELHYTMCSMEDLLRRAAGMRERDAKKAKLQFEIDADGVEVWADPDRIVQAATNLVSNAIKFSPKGGRILLKAVCTEKDEAQIEVRDGGQGIPESKLEQIFDPFQQVDGSDSRVTGGTGLGLAICRAIVLQHRGRIWAKSKLGEGASFFFTLPVKASEHLRRGAEIE